MSRNARLLGVLIPLAITCATVRAEDAVKAAANAEKVGNLSLDLAVPESPAFTVLGVTPSDVSRPSNPADVATSLLNGLDRNGNFQTGLAIDMRPYSLLKGKDTDLRTYVDNYYVRFLNRIQVSIATAKGVNDDDKRSRVALGFKVTPWDRGDAHLDESLAACFHSAPTLTRRPSFVKLKDEFVRQGLSEADAQKAADKAAEAWETEVHAHESTLQVKAEACRTDAKARRWNRSAWDIAFAPAWGSKDSRVSDLRSDGYAFWTSLAYGFEDLSGDFDGMSKDEREKRNWLTSLLQDNTQLLIHLRYREHELVPDPKVAKTFFRQDGFAAGGKLRMGTDRFSISGEALYLKDEPDGRGRSSKENYQLTLTGEVRLLPHVWAEVAVGQRGARTSGAHDEGFVLTNLKWGFSADPTDSKVP